MQRLSFVVIPAIVAIGLFFSLNLLEDVSSSRDSIAPSASVRQVEAYGEGINTVLFDALGRIDYTLQSSRQVFYQDQETELESPYIRLFSEGEARWNIVAKSGRISAAGDGSNEISNIDLLGGVEVYMLDDFGNRTMLATEYLNVNPQLETLETEAPVQMSSEGLEQSAIGMQANLKDETILFKRDVRGVYVVPRE
ncbi:MAG: LPS export ABC transporter periplasmic protein LptC [Pseudohongiellaceae bacterium]